MSSEVKYKIGNLIEWRDRDIGVVINYKEEEIGIFFAKERKTMYFHEIVARYGIVKVLKESQ